MKPPTGRYYSADRRYARNIVDKIDSQLRSLDNDPWARARWEAVASRARELADVAEGIAAELRARENAEGKPVEGQTTLDGVVVV